MAESDWTDKQIVEQVLAGSVDDFRLLVERYKDPVYNMAYRMTGNPEDAAEMAHTAFIKGFQKLNQYNSNYPFSRWIIGICCNRSKNLFRKRSRRRQAEESHLEYAYCAISGGGRDYQRQRLDEVSIALQRIPEKMRLPVAMKYMEDFSYEEIAAAMGIGVSAAKMRVKRGVEQLRQKLGPPFEEKNNAAAQ